MHTFGIYCLHKSKKVQKIQRVILTNLSVTELVMTVTFSCDVYFKFLSHDESRVKTFKQVYEYIKTGLFCNYLLCMMLMTGDRLLCALLCLTYKVHVTKSRLIKVIIFIWLLSLFFVSIAYFPSGGAYMVKFVGCCFLFITILTYSTIAYKLNQRSRQFATVTQATNNNRNQFRKHYVIPLLILITFVIFVAIPFDLRVFMESSLYLDLFRYLLGSVNFIMDPLIYVFLHQEIRKTALNTLRCFRGKKSKPKVDINRQKSKDGANISSSNTKTLPVALYENIAMISSVRISVDTSE